jgi:hypothetical protein
MILSSGTLAGTDGVVAGSGCGVEGGCWAMATHDHASKPAASHDDCRSLVVLSDAGAHTLVVAAVERRLRAVHVSQPRSFAASQYQSNDFHGRESLS